VSRLPRTVFRKMWSDIWSSFVPEEIPISHIINGVHASTWITREVKALITKYCGLNLEGDLLRKENEEKAAAIPDEILWKTHLELKDKLFTIVKERVTQNWTREGEVIIFQEKEEAIDFSGGAVVADLQLAGSSLRSLREALDVGGARLAGGQDDLERFVEEGIGLSQADVESARSRWELTSFVARYPTVAAKSLEAA
jgi:hypothetical protein